MKIVISKGSEFNKSQEAEDLYELRSGLTVEEVWEQIFSSDDVECRSDPLLVALVEELGEKANPPGGWLKVLDVPVPVQGVCIRAGGYAQGKYEEYVTENAREWW